jgi:hypothetical protein
LVVISVLTLAVWARAAAGDAPPPAEGDPAIRASDYADANNWMVITTEPRQPVDVFVYYPTAYAAGADDPKVSTIDDAGMRAGAREFLRESASAIATAEIGNVFIPYYRQVDALWGVSQARADQARYFGGLPRADAFAAFDHYIRHYNGGRPFIVLGHSQGALMVKRLLFEYMKEHPDVYARMVVAYAIGISITRQELADHPHVRFAAHAADTGVVVSYNTEAPRLDGPSPTWLPGSIAINPITWTRGAAPAPASANLGSHLKDARGEYRQVAGVADARVDVERGVVICSTADLEQYSFQGIWRASFPRGVFHHYDIPFYYYNLRENARARVARFLAAPADGVFQRSGPTPTRAGSNSQCH